jgi:AbrB family looped-hinge helix DNA binding protein
MNAVLSEKGQVTIPKAIRDGLGLVPGSILDFQAAQGRIVVSKVLARDPIQSWRGKGKLPGGKSVMEYLEGTRDE